MLACHGLADNVHTMPQNTAYESQQAVARYPGAAIPSRHRSGPERVFAGSIKTAAFVVRAAPFLASISAAAMLVWGRKKFSRR